VRPTPSLVSRKQEKKELIILGAGGTSRSIAGAIEAINRRRQQWRLLGYLDDDPSKQGLKISGFPVLGTLDSARKYPSCQFIIGAGNPGQPLIRQQIVERIRLDSKLSFATITHPSTDVSRRASVGIGTAILQNAVIECDATIGNHVLITQGVCIGHDAAIGDFATIAPGVIVSGYARVGPGAYLGAGSVIKEGITVGEGAVIGMGSVVIRDVSAHTTVVGNPARLIVEHGTASTKGMSV